VNNKTKMAFFKPKNSKKYLNQKNGNKNSQYKITKNKGEETKREKLRVFAFVFVCFVKLTKLFVTFCTPPRNTTTTLKAHKFQTVCFKPYLVLLSAFSFACNLLSPLRP